MVLAALPPELIDSVVSELAKSVFDPAVRYYRSSSLAVYAAVSKAWQQQIERRTFRDLDLTPQRLAALSDHNIITPYRLSCVREIRLIVDAGVQEDTSPDTLGALDQAVFETSIRELFSLLKPLDFIRRPRFHSSSTHHTLTGPSWAI